MDGPHPVFEDFNHNLIDESATFESFCASIDQQPHFHSSKDHGDLTDHDENSMYDTCLEDSIQSDTSGAINLNDPNITTSTQFDKSIHPALTNDQARTTQLKPAINQSDNRKISQTSTSDQSDTNSDFVIIPTPAGSQDGDKRSTRGSTSNQSGTSSDFVVIHTPEATDYQNSSFDIISNKPEASDESVFNDDTSEDCFLNISGTIDHENHTIIYTETPVRVTSAVKCCYDDEIAAADETTEDTLTASNTHDATNTASNDSGNTTLVEKSIKPEMNEEKGPEVKDDLKLEVDKRPDTMIAQDKCLNDCHNTTNENNNKAKEIDGNENKIILEYNMRDRRVHSLDSKTEKNRHRRVQSLSNEREENKRWRVQSLNHEIEENMKKDQVEQWLSHNAACTYNEDIATEQRYNKDDTSDGIADDTSNCIKNNCEESPLHTSKSANYIFEGKLNETCQRSIKQRDGSFHGSKSENNIFNGKSDELQRFTRRKVAEVGPYRSSSDRAWSIASDVQTSSNVHQDDNHTNGSVDPRQYNTAVSSSDARLQGTIQAVADRLRNVDGVITSAANMNPSAESLHSTDVTDMNNNPDIDQTTARSTRCHHTKAGHRNVEMYDKQTQTDWDTSRIRVIIQKVKDAACWLWKFLTRLCHNIARHSAKTADRLCQWFEQN